MSAFTLIWNVCVCGLHIVCSQFFLSHFSLLPPKKMRKYLVKQIREMLAGELIHCLWTTSSHVITSRYELLLSVRIEELRESYWNECTYVGGYWLVQDTSFEVALQSGVVVFDQFFHWQAVLSHVCTNFVAPSLDSQALRGLPAVAHGAIAARIWQGNDDTLPYGTGYISRVIWGLKSLQSL